MGDGHSVQVWKVAWILDLPAPFQNYFPESVLGANMGVKDLICADTSSWDSKKKKNPGDLPTNCGFDNLQYYHPPYGLAG